ncbi:hypothetical protein GUITHDRAFT_148840 [Guillardia theta CCMP2712]|uniref:Uncharacterized protein n=1 Tax=Guillardia theta (strain CCMP2712) TaxID=905079 RepID=L1I787_GUITC|nr:hypothetical protein GUITHDRAFT_148840 [Guillardia theta CCMP2712]EKX32121.1 hypothetical protein GUITHDRAFT_148840 [Guillardia theta CCMP2712]|eukprot:XP_005819101.1 hypothetical protein GUITHDRAFT_148840 [Guillardia theta CCMP2712]
MGPKKQKMYERKQSLAEIISESQETGDLDKALDAVRQFIKKTSTDPFKDKFDTFKDPFKDNFDPFKDPFKDKFDTFKDPFKASAKSVKASVKNTNLNANDLAFTKTAYDKLSSDDDGEWEELS